jgi:sulfite reductase (ferredoxin)
MVIFREGIQNLNSIHTKSVVEKDIIELGKKIQAYKDGEISDDKFRALRLARGVYGQRQQGVQMIRIKLPFGKVTANQLRKICDVSDEYSTGKLHITTRQDIQIHYVSLDRTPELWAELEKEDVTLREACGNTVRNVTASHLAGIDPNEPFDVAPYADLVFRYFLRKPIGQELGRKIKIAFSGSEMDESYTFIHDFGFIPKVENNIKGFKVLVAGGLGAQPVLALTAYDFLPAEQILPFIEASIRVFDRYGERNNRNKARLKYLIAKIGFDDFLKLVTEEQNAVQFSLDEDFKLFEQQDEYPVPENILTKEDILAQLGKTNFSEWVKTNTFNQKQKGYLGVYIKVVLGNFNTNQARKLAELVDKFTGSEFRFTIDQNILLKFVLPENLLFIYEELKKIGLASSGYNSVADITACPGTDTCNLGISNSTEVARVLEDVVRNEYPDLIYNSEIKIKISGCMNSCGQHGLAHIGLHGSSMKVEKNTLPALQLLLGGGKLGNGEGRIAEKVIKFPSKRVLDVLRTLFNDYEKNQITEEEGFDDYYQRNGNKYFYDLIKPLTDISTIKEEDFIDWGSEDKFKTEIGVGECAGVMIDLVATLLYDADEKLIDTQYAIKENRWADAIYHSYAAGIHTAKALLISKNIRCNTHSGIIADFESNFGDFYGFKTAINFSSFIMQINSRKADEAFAREYYEEVNGFVKKAKESRE